MLPTDSCKHFMFLPEQELLRQAGGIDTASPVPAAGKQKPRRHHPKEHPGARYGLS